MSLTAGTRLGAYEILAPLGAGGMGEVYRARDTRLGREIAVKVVSERLAGDAGALTRFEREARAIASLSHPNILAIHDFGRDGEITYAVMELLEGHTLDARIGAADFTAREALQIAVSIADGLASAHGKGVVHRDLKPANISLTRDGLVKILDFGLARTDALRSEVQPAAATRSVETAPGVMLGTVGYMSPEQVRGEPADHRSDVFSLGCVLYEMLSGRPPFARDTSAETLAAILRDQPPDFVDGSRNIPPRVDAVVRRCLEKNPDQRFQSARDLAFALRECSSAPENAATTRRAPRRAIAAAVLVLIAAAGWWLGGRSGFGLPLSGPKVRSLAVLPLTNLSGDPGQDSFADAMTEELTTRLARMGSWRITSRASVMGYRGTQKPLRDIARELGVDAVIEGSIIREGSRVKVTAQLIDAEANQHMWADTYERQIESVLAIQNDVARAIAREVGLTLTPQQDAGLTAATRNVLPAAYDAYVRGRHAWNKRTEADLRQAVRFFQESIDADPTYAPAFAGLADSYAQLGYGSYISPEDSFPRARAAAQKALEFDPMLADAHASLGYVLMYYDWNFTLAEREYKTAIELNPNSATAREWYAYLLTAMERLSEAEREIGIAKTLDPLSVPIVIDRAFILHYYGKNEEALRSVNLALEMNPKAPMAYFWLGRINTYEGRYEQALAAFNNIGPLRTWTPAMSAVGFLYGQSGKTKEAQGILAEFDDIARQGRYASSYAIAVVHAGLGDRERAFAALDAAYRERSHWLLWLKRDPRWNALHADPRFQALARKVGLPS